MGLTWSEFQKAAPELAAVGERLLHPSVGAAVGLLATADRTARPGVAPVCPIFAGSGVFVLVVSKTPKRRDLAENPRFALHAMVGPSDEEFRISGTARLVDIPSERAAVIEAIRFPSYDATDPIFELLVERALAVTWPAPGESLKRAWPGAHPRTGDPTMSSDYRTYLEERFQGEVFGEAIFRSFADAVEDPDHARKLRHLQQLESETRDLLHEALEEEGLPAREDAKRASEGEALGAKLARRPWSDVMRGFQRDLEGFVVDFRNAEALAPAGKAGLLRHLTAHEEALLEFARCECARDAARDSLEAVIALLNDLPQA